MTSPPSPLLNDALAVFDQLEAAAAKNVPTPSRREQLTALVTEVSRRDGHGWTSKDILRAVDDHLAQVPAVRSPAPSSTSTFSLRSRWSVLAQGLGACRRGWRSWWTSASTGRLWLQGLMASAGTGLALAFLPWGSVVRAPFALAAIHPQVYIVLLITMVGAAITSAIHGSRRGFEGWSFGSGVAAVLLAFVGMIGGGVAHMNAHDTSDVRAFQRGLYVVDTSLVSARAKLKVGTPITDIIAAANETVMADRGTWFTNVGQFDPSRGVLREHASLNPAECRLLTSGLGLPSRFHVAAVNGTPYTGGPLSCPFIWSNDVVVEGSPG